MFKRGTASESEDGVDSVGCQFAKLTFGAFVPRINDAACAKCPKECNGVAARRSTYDPRSVPLGELNCERANSAGRAEY
jgi:hypothetical protein